MSQVERIADSLGPQFGGDAYNIVSKCVFPLLHARLDYMLIGLCNITEIAITLRTPFACNSLARIFQDMSIDWRSSVGGAQVVCLAHFLRI